MSIPAGLESYRGNKAIPGLSHWIINHIPAHTVYYEPFCGSAAIASMLPARVHKVLNDCDAGVIDKINCGFLNGSFTAICGTAVQLIESILPTADTDTFVYMDPPYIIESRKWKKRIYKFEMTVSAHEHLLALAVKAKFNCMISHYEHPVYDDLLKGWIKAKKKVRYHNSTVQECIYMNYPIPSVLQSYDKVGINCWDRQRIKRKIERLAKKLSALPDIERNAVITRVSQLVQIK